MAVRGQAAHAAAGGPHDGVVDVAVVAAAMAEHAQRQHLRAMRDACHAHAVVGALGAGGAGDVGAVPAAGFGRVVGVDALGVVHPGRGVGPVADIPAAGHAAVRVAAGDVGIGDEVVTGIPQRGVDVDVGGDAGVQHGDDDAGAVGQVPRVVDVAAAPVRVAEPVGGAVGRLQVPLVFGVVGVVRGERGRAQRVGAADVAHRPPQQVGLDVGHRRIGGDLLDQRGRLGPIELARGADEVRAYRQFALVARRDRLQRRPRQGTRRPVQAGTVDRRAHGLRRRTALHGLRAAVAIGDDETIIGDAVLQAADIETRRRRSLRLWCARRRCRHRKCHGHGGRKQTLEPQVLRHA